MHRSTGSKILIIRRLQSITCSGCMAMQPTSNDGKFAPTDPDRPFSHGCSFQDGMRCLDGFNWYAACNIGRSSNPVGHGSPGLARRHPISAVRDEDSKLHRHGFCSARGGRRMRVGAADSAPVGTPMRAEGARLPGPCSTRTRSVCARLLRPVLSPARRASARGNASRLRQQSMSRPALKVDRSLVPKWKPPVITAISPWGAGSRPRPGRPTGLARTLVPIRASAPEDAGSSSPCSIPGGSTIHPLASVPSPSGHHDPTTPRRLPLSLPNRHVLIGWERTPCGTSGDDPTQLSFFSHYPGSPMGSG